MTTRRAPLALAAITILACCSAPRIDTVDALVAALERQGFAFTERTPFSLNIRYARIDESIALEGDGLTMEILRITDRRTWGVVSDGAMILALAESRAGREFPGRPDIIVRAPFVVVVRQEPAPGAVRAAVESLLPGE